MSEPAIEPVNRPSGMPDPVVVPGNEGVWLGAAQGCLVVQRCAGCGAHRYPPTDGCYRCTGLEWEWDTLPGTGSIYSFIWVPDRARLAEDSDAVYNVAVVTVDGTEGEPVRILSNVVDAWSLGDLQVGQRVELAPVGFSEEYALPCFRTVSR